MKSKKLFLFGMALLCLIPGIFAQNYAEVLQKSMFFYEAQRAGTLPSDNRVNWRANSCVNDGADVGTDLSKGWYDAGDHVKFNFPMAWSVTVLAWGALEYPEGYTNAGQMGYLKENIKWVTDYFINCHPSPNQYYYQVGDGNADHAKWTAAEIVEHIMARPTAEVNPSVPGTEVAAETAAAMAAASMLFASSDPAYSATLLQHAIELYDFADTYRGTYPLDAFYKSWSGYNDELTWGAIWLYKATGDNSYLEKAKVAYESMGKEIGTDTPVYKHTFSWDDKAYACYVLLAQLTGETKYITDAERFLDHWAYNIERTPAGLPYQADNSWGILRYASNTAICALVYSDFTSNATKKADYYNMAKFIADYAAGNNPENLSYVVGYGTNWPKHIHHRTAHGWPDGFPNGDVPDNRHILYGALVGGPNFSDVYIDDINQYEYTEVACDYNASFSGVIARLSKDNSSVPITNFPIAEQPSKEYYVNLKLNVSSSNSFELLGWLVNASAWPARYTENLAFRYYIDITEGIAAGYTAADYTTSGSGTVSGLLPYDVSKNIYYVEAVQTNKAIFPGGEGDKQEFVSLGISLPDATAGAWDTSNDWSFKGISSSTDYTYNPYMPVYENGIYLDGLEPGEGGTIVPVTGISVLPKTISLVTANESAQIVATITPDSASNKAISWTTSNSAIATVSSSGIVTAISNGTATITATTLDGSFTDDCSVSVNIPVVDVPVTGVSLAPTSLTLNEGETSTLSTTISPANATDQSVSYSSDNTTIASVSQSGVVTATGAGIATITVTTTDGSFTDTCIVTVSAAPINYSLTTSVIGNGTISLNPAGGIYSEGQVVELTATATTGNIFVEWTGNIVSISNPVTITMDANKTVSATFTTDTTSSQPCDSPVAVTVPFSQDGVGNFCWITSDDISFINGWNLNSLTINGVDFTNTWANSFPAKIDGKYYISYDALFPWSHFEANSLKSAGPDEDTGIAGIYPNPFNTSTTIHIENIEDIRMITVLDEIGRIIKTYSSSEISYGMEIGNDFPSGIYLISVQSINGTSNHLINKR